MTSTLDHQPISGPSAWRGDELSSSTDWIYLLSDAERDGWSSSDASSSLTIPTCAPSRPPTTRSTHARPSTPSAVVSSTKAAASSSCAA
ncbi:hypothetical protein [Aeromicrobium sp. UC242_57]|uniref:hypothetical protein n=1 Tax=Aeromicrobium sp. UC242_57 TaxID=3374624 RepID=UPI0037BD2C35